VTAHTPSHGSAQALRGVAKSSGNALGLARRPAACLPRPGCLLQRPHPHPADCLPNGGRSRRRAVRHGSRAARRPAALLPERAPRERLVATASRPRRHTGPGAPRSRSISPARPLEARRALPCTADTVVENTTLESGFQIAAHLGMESSSVGSWSAVPPPYSIVSCSRRPNRWTPTSRISSVSVAAGSSRSCGCWADCSAAQRMGIPCHEVVQLAHTPRVLAPGSYHTCGPQASGDARMWRQAHVSCSGMVLPGRSRSVGPASEPEGGRRRSVGVESAERGA
jgi:hypothetical protein